VPPLRLVVGITTKQSHPAYALWQKCERLAGDDLAALHVVEGIIDEYLDRAARKTGGVR
jgi:hypothetical protein